MSFWMVPEMAAGATPCRRDTARYSARRMIAVALIVIEVETRSSGIPSRSSAISSMESIATPTRPTSPAASSWSESYPICVGRSKATLRPVTPCFRRYR
jgi:hypothetical protein